LEVLSSANEEEMQMQLMKNPDIKLVLIDDSTECLEHVLNRVKKYPKMQILIVSEQAGNASKQDQEFVHKSDTDKIKDYIVARLNDYNKVKNDSGLLKNSLRQDIEYKMGKGKVISEVLDRVEKYAKKSIPLIIEGATGTGKELIVEYICRLSGREAVTVNCGAMSKELVNSELFGSVKGAFTGARDVKGKVEAAEGGILFLDEFNSLSYNVQENLLGLIESNTFTKVGDTVKRKADVGIIAASNQSIKKMVEKGELRQDLYERFVKTIYLPTLSERIEDINYFIDRFIAEENKALNKTASISNDARKFLAGHDWPGNIRQLKNCIESLVIEVEPDKSSKKHIIQIPLVLEWLNERGQNESCDIREDDYTLRTAHDCATKEAIKRALAETNGNNTKAIKLLNVSHGSYYNFKKRLGI
jgi:transcriptional regulator with PAS, ATPase and Fis domain